MAAAVPVIGFLIVSGTDTPLPPVVWLFAALFITPLLPAAIGIAVLRYRLFEIDRIVSRTIAYATVTAILAVVFLVGMLLIQSVLASVTSDSTLAVAASTLVVAALFQPLMRRIRRRVDRRFDRARYDGDRIVDEFARRLRSDVELTTLLGDLIGTTHRSVAPSAAGVWIRASG
jgi:Zn-dependent protease with chaperone function